jgi:hypothetical protein
MDRCAIVWGRDVEELSLLRHYFWDHVPVRIPPANSLQAHFLAYAAGTIDWEEFWKRRTATQSASDYDRNTRSSATVLAGRLFTPKEGVEANNKRQQPGPLALRRLAYLLPGKTPGGPEPPWLLPLIGSGAGVILDVIRIILARDYYVLYLTTVFDAVSGAIAGSVSRRFGIFKAVAASTTFAFFSHYF